MTTKSYVLKFARKRDIDPLNFLISGNSESIEDVYFLVEN